MPPTAVRTDKREDRIQMTGNLNCLIVDRLLPRALLVFSVVSSEIVHFEIMLIFSVYKSAIKADLNYINSVYIYKYHLWKYFPKSRVSCEIARPYRTRAFVRERAHTHTHLLLAFCKNVFFLFELWWFYATHR